MNLSQFLYALRARYAVIVLTLGFCVVAAVAVTLLSAKTYQAQTSMVVNYRGIDSVTGLTLPAQMMPGYIATQVEIIKSMSVAYKVVDALKLTGNPVAQEQLGVRSQPASVPPGPGAQDALRNNLAGAVLQALEVVPSHDSSVLSLQVKGKDPKLVAALANAFAAAYLDFSVQLKTQPAQQASAFITAQIKTLRDQYEQAQNRLSAYQKQKNIYSADNRLDIETARLNELSSQLVQVQAQAIEATSRQRQAQSNAGGSPDVLNNSLIQSLKSRLAIAESGFALIAQRLAPNHPQYIAAKSELDQVRRSLDEQIRATSTGVTSNATILQQREAELRNALTAQKAKVLALNGARDEMSVLANEADNARHAYETASQRVNQTNLEGQSKQADIAVLTAAIPPTVPSGPRLLKNTALALVVGLMLGIGLVLLLELLDQRIRSSAQLAELLDLPVLGGMGRASTPRMVDAPDPFGRGGGSRSRLTGGAISLEHL